MWLFIWNLRIVSVHADSVNDVGSNLPNDDDGRQIHYKPLLFQEDEQKDIETLKRSIQARSVKSIHMEYDEETIEIEQ